MALLAALSFFLSCSVLAQTENQPQKKQHKIHGLYFQWGYNTESYTRSTLHFRMGNGDHFSVKNVQAADRRSYEAIWQHPTDISIPQYNWRLGFYINAAKTRALELNFDHIKYVVSDGQEALVQGVIDGKAVNKGMVLDPKTFLHFEHTDGGNLLHINYVQLKPFWPSKDQTRYRATAVGKVGAGINIPRTDFTWRGDRLNNRFHIAGYNLAAEAGLRFNATRTLFLEATGKAGFVQVLNALANTTTTTGNRVSHGYGYLEAIATIGFNIGHK